MSKQVGGKQFLDVNIIIAQAEVYEGMRVADLGCGSTGHFVFPIAHAVGPGGTVYAVDIMKTSLAAIDKRIKQENLKNIKPVWSNLEIFGATAIDNDTLDRAFLINTLYQSGKRAAILREAIRLLKKDGRLLVIEWKNVNLPFGPPVEDRVRMDLLIQGAGKLGLVYEKEFFVGQYHYGLIFSK